MKSMNFNPSLNSELSNFIIENQIGEERKYIYNVILKNDDRGYLMLKNASHINRNIKNIRYAIRNIVRIVKALKSYSHLDQSKTLSSANITEGIEDTLVILHNQIKYGIKVVRNFQEIPSVICNPDELNQVWTNLIQNAIQALKGKGKSKFRFSHKTVLSSSKSKTTVLEFPLRFRTEFGIRFSRPKIKEKEPVLV